MIWFCWKNILWNGFFSLFAIFFWVFFNVFLLGLRIELTPPSSIAALCPLAATIPSFVTARHCDAIKKASSLRTQRPFPFKHSHLTGYLDRRIMFNIMTLRFCIDVIQHYHLANKVQQRRRAGQEADVIPMREPTVPVHPLQTGQPDLRGHLISFSIQNSK